MECEKKEYIVPKRVKDPDFGVDLYNPSELMSTEFGQVLIGSLLGDATIHKTYFIYSFRHSKIQKTYLLKKREILRVQMKIYEDNKIRTRMLNNRIIKSNKSLCCWTKMYPFLEKIRKDFYPKNKKIINLDYLEHLNILGFLIWFYDDGSIRYSKEHGSSMLICSDSFKKNLEKARLILQKNFQLNEIKISKRNRLIFGSKSRRRLANLILKNISLDLLETMPNKHKKLISINNMVR
mgnify:CR=1 FL=1